MNFTQREGRIDKSDTEKTKEVSRKESRPEQIENEQVQLEGDREMPDEVSLDLETNKSANKGQSIKNKKRKNEANTLNKTQDVKRIINAYLRSSKKSRGFIVLSFAPGLPEEFTVVTDWWEWFPSIYL